MNESITRAAGAAHGEELPPRRMEALIRAAGAATQLPPPAKTRTAGKGAALKHDLKSKSAIWVAVGRTPRQRTTLYGQPPAEQVARSLDAAPLLPTAASVLPAR